MQHPAALISTEKLVIRGELAAPDFPAWIIHRARRLGLRGGILEVDEHAIQLLVAGPPDLIDAMEVGCSLGPTSVQVDRIDRIPSTIPVADKLFAYVADD